MIKRDEYVQKIIAYKDTPFVKILTGIRRCGKSTIFKMIIEELEHMGVDKERILSYSFDSLLYEGMSAKQLYNEIVSKIGGDNNTYYIFLDEIQEIKNWEKVVNSLMSEKNVDIYVTGSNSRMMSSEISTYLTGRYISFRIFPLSFKEYLKFKKTYREVGDSHKELANYLKEGGFPATNLKEYSQDEIYTIVRDIYNSTIFTDIVKRNQIRKVDRLERIVKFVLSNIGNTFSAASVSKYLKSEQRVIDNETVYDYLKKLENAYILHRCPRFDLQGKEILKTQEKFYVADTSLKYSVLGYTPDSVAASLENIVYMELLRRGYSVNIGKIDNVEIDFVAVRQEMTLYIQVTQEIRDEKTQLREYDNLLNIKDNYPKYVLRTDEFAAGNYKGIKTMHIADFLLSEEF